MMLAEKTAEILEYDGDIKSAVNRAGGKIVYSDDADLYVKSIGDFIITVPSHTTPQRNNFLIAKKLGYYFLHHVLDRPLSEREAVRFAYSFLMPESKFKPLGFGYLDILKTADKYHVTPVAVENRMKMLNMI